jgi:ABC-type Na+ transport system ATPase subunit NatA
MGKGEAEEDVATAAASPIELLRERRRRADGAGDGTASGGASSALRHQVGGGGDGVPVSGVDVAPHKGLQAAEKVAVAVISTALPGPRAGAGSTAGGLPRPGGGCCVDNDDGEGPSAAEDSISPSQHTRILLQKNLKLKQQQYFSFTRVVCLPAPFAILVEFMLPLACILALTWVKTLTDIIVHPQGWGGDVPQNQLDPSTPCVAGIDYHWERATAPDEDRTTSCRPYLEVLRQPQDFWRVLAQLHALPQVKLALAADRLEDVAKVRTMRRWIDTNWYPRTYLNDVPCFGGELIAGDIGWDKEAMSGANRFRNCSHHGVNPGEISGFEDITVMVGDGTSEALQQYITGLDYEHDGRPRIWAAVEFDRIPGGGRPGEHSGDWEYSIRLNITHADTRSMQIGSPTRKHMWSTEYYSTLYGFAGHMSLQLLVDRYIIGRRAADTPAASVLESHNFQKFHVDARYEVDLVQTLSPAQLEVLAEPMRYEPQIVQLLPMPEDGWRKADFYRVVKSVFALVFMLLYMYSVFNIIASLVEEKETRVRELLRMMSVGNTALLASWYLTYAAVFGVLNFVIVVACKMPGGMFEYSDYSVLFVFFSLFSVSAISYAYMVHTFFDKAKTGGVVGMLMFFSMYFCYTAFRSDDTPASIKQAISYFAPCSFAYGVDQLVSREEISEGMHWSNMQEPLEGRWSGVSFAQILRKLLIDAVIYSLLGFYLDQVLPKEFGMRRSPWFPIEQIFPSGKRRVQVGAVDTGTPETATKGDNFEAVNLPNTQQLESENRCVLIDGLRKTFDTPDGEKVAVQGLTLRMYAGQIFVLLGHNGAGKTTTINMLTGLYQPTSGDARVFGKSIVAEMPAVRRRISVCPQHDVLFLTLTVFENLEFFAALRGVPATARDAQVLKKIGQVGLTEKTHAKAGSLSGGMKRKLSLAIALIGDTGAVFLDEPTSGMDPYSRRSTWNTLQSEKAGRVMILTTHFMEEADLLGDRIGETF